jgi:ethanolamine utilization protein EutQ
MGILMTLVNTSLKKSPVRLQRFDQLNFVPRFEYGHMAESSEICGLKDGSELAAGFVRMRGARMHGARMHGARIPRTIQYDETLIVLEGSLRIHIDDEVFEMFERDSIWLPAGTKLIYEAESALIAYAIHPSNWHEQINDEK